MSNDQTPRIPGRDLAAQPPAAPRDVEMPVAQAARSLEHMNRPFLDGLTYQDLVAELERSFDSDEDAALLLHTQARMLDSLFKRIVLRDMHGPYKGHDGIPHLKEHELGLALRSQKQSRMALETLMHLRKSRDSK